MKASAAKSKEREVVKLVGGVGGKIYWRFTF